MAGINFNTADYLLNTGDITSAFKHNIQKTETPKFGVEEPKGAEKSFSEMLSDSIKKVEDLQREADKKSMDLATGKTNNISETMIAVSKAEIAFQLMTQVRSKAINAYNEIMRMQV